MKNKANLLKTILNLTSENELDDFLTGVLTPGEYKELCTRLEIIRLLKMGLPQREIADKLGVGIATVTRGSREIKAGRFDMV